MHMLIFASCIPYQYKKGFTHTLLRTQIWTHETLVPESLTGTRRLSTREEPQSNCYNTSARTSAPLKNTVKALQRLETFYAFTKCSTNHD